jgi:hypothetical protein
MTESYHEFCPLCWKHPINCKLQCGIVDRVKEDKRKAEAFDQIAEASES